MVFAVITIIIHKHVVVHYYFYNYTHRQNKTMSYGIFSPQELYFKTHLNIKIIIFFEIVFFFKYIYHSMVLGSFR